LSNIDKQRVAAVRKLERLGYTFAAGDWHAPAGMIAATPTSVPAALARLYVRRSRGEAVPAAAGDAMHALLVQRADALEGCTEGSEEERELAAISDAIEAYETLRWPNGKVDGGKG
jgi:hypothetical protein